MSKENKTAKNKVFESLVTAFTFVAAISWRETLITLLERVFPEENGALWAEITITLIITIIAITVIYMLVKAERIVDHTILDKEEDDSSDDTQREDK